MTFTSILLSILDLLFLSWFFWPLVIALPCIAYAIVSSHDDKDYPFGPEFLIGIAVAAVLYHFPSARSLFASWRGWVWLGLSYVVAGFLLSLYKWLQVLWDFRKNPAYKIQIQTKRADVKLKNPEWDDDRIAAEVVSRLHLSKCKVELTGNVVTAYPDWHEYPIATWWVYFPFFLLSIPFDWIKRIVTQVTNWLRQFWDSIAKQFSVKG